MFTGIVEGTGRVRSIEARDGARRLVVEPPGWDPLPSIGASVSVAGACLTTTAHEGGGLAFDVIPETIDRTSLGALKPGDAVNLERALRIGDRLDGHFVQGHVDGTGTVRGVTRDGGDVRLRIAADRSLLDGLIPKGSVTVDGVSLTVAGLDDGMFEVALIPETLARTTLGSVAEGDAVNLEVDLIGKWVRRLLPGM